MRQILFFTIAVFSLFLTSCSDDADYRYERMEEIIVHAQKEYYFYPGTSIKSSRKAYVITDKEGRNSAVESIEGFDELYQEGKEYHILVALCSRKEIWLDDFGYRYKFIMLLE